MKRENKMFVVTAVISFLSGLVFRHGDTYKVTGMGLLTAVAGALAYYLWLRVRKAETDCRRCAVLCSIMGLFTLALMQGTSWVRSQETITDETLAWGTLSVFIVLLTWCGLCIFFEKGITENTVTMVIFAGFLMKLYYVVMTQGHLLQNDIEKLADCGGHLGYVYYIYTTHSVPLGNPIGGYQFYQPPLYYVITAIWLKIYALLGVDPAQWDEALQMLPVFYTTAILVFLNKIGIRLRYSPLGRCVTLGLAAFLPYSIYLGGALNNDPLTTLFMVMCVYFTIKWYQEPQLKTIIAMAVCIGCAMMTKLSGAMIAPAMAVVMLWKAWQNRQQWKDWVKQFACFGLIAFPLGLWHPVHCWIDFDMPIGYVPAIPLDDVQYIGMYTKWNRFQDFRRAVEYLATRWGPPPDVDYNIPVSLVKFSVFNELHYYDSNQMTYLLGTILFWATAVLFVLFVAAFVGWLFMRDHKMIYKVFFGAGSFVILYGYVKFCLAYPFVCTMNVRYVMTALYIGMLVLGATVSGVQDKLAGKSAVVRRLFTAMTVSLTAFYVLCSSLLNFHLEILLF